MHIQIIRLFAHMDLFEPHTHRFILQVWTGTLVWENRWCLLVSVGLPVCEDRSAADALAEHVLPKIACVGYTFTCDTCYSPVLLSLFVFCHLSC